jgi:hypothetical protein
MRKEITIAAITLLLTATPAFAQSSHANNDHHNGNSDETHTNQNNGTVKGIQTQNIPFIHTNEPDRDDITITPTTIPSVSPAVSPAVSPSIAPCNPDDNWKNHGAYVSCIAHLHESGHFVAKAAHHDNDNDKDDHPSITPSVEPSTSPEPSMSPEPSASPSVSPVPSVSPTPLTTAMGNIGDNEPPFYNFQSLFGRFFGFFRHWHWHWF